ncbi:hypothetical protein EXN66_Car003780 [Channa argus]|uniref:Uncharacterized protein n=1 Tax=Channa argus TaxID=215402 RepID=A0A6G1PDL6_CHAAH|nr:hypothetical protein EXN66_Car003780 [Channa argus]
MGDKHGRRRQLKTGDNDPNNQRLNKNTETQTLTWGLETKKDLTEKITETLEN